MKALSLTQPWATLVVIGAKRIETRSWRTSHRGPLLIHAAKALPKDWSLFRHPDFVKALEPLVGLNKFDVPNIDLLPRGALLGTVNVWLCQETIQVTIRLPRDEPERMFGDYSAGRYAWLLEDPFQWTESVPWKGRQRLFEVPREQVV